MNDNPDSVANTNGTPSSVLETPRIRIRYLIGRHITGYPVPVDDVPPDLAAPFHDAPGVWIWLARAVEEEFLDSDDDPSGPPIPFRPVRLDCGYESGEEIGSIEYLWDSVPVPGAVD